MAYAYDATGDSKYLNGALQSMDYIFGRNGMGFSYVTGCGTYHAQYPVHEYWIKEINTSYPMAPDGVMVGGPFSYDYDNYMKLLGYKAASTPPQKFYTDSIEAWSVNTPALDWQAGFAWNIAFFGDVFGKNDVAVVTTTTTPTGTTTTTTTTRNISDTTTTTSVTTMTTTIDTTATTSRTITNDETVYYGDANCDGTIDMSDAVLIMQALANPNKYGIGGSDKHALTEEGKKNADVEGQNGLTTQDALTIQRYLLKLVDSLPV
jgi:endoglucanase